MYYGFRESPFSLTPDPKFAYSSTSHERALQTIVHALGRREGLIVVTGDIGCGKTTLCRRLLPLLPPRTFLSLVLNPFLAADDLLTQVLEDYDLAPAGDVRRGSLARSSCHELVRTLHEFLNTLSQVNGTAVIIIDEAQNLPLRTLEQIRLLSNFETDTTKLLQIILVGQRELEPILELDEMRQLNQRVSRRCRIEPLSSREVAEYVEYRLSVATPAGEAPPVRFTSGALTTISRLSEGVPRIINLLCDRSLEIGDARGEVNINRVLVLAAAKDLELPVSTAIRFGPDIALRPLLRGAAAAALVGAAAGGIYVTRGTWLNWLDGSAETSTQVAQAPPPAAATPSPAAPSLDLAALKPDPAAAPQPDSPAPPATAILEAAPSYELTVASFETAGRARKVADDLVGQGHPARVSTSDSGRWQMVIVGPYTSLTEAMDASATLERLGFAGIRLAKSP
ncbi:MAG TPA: AAA family ATPase [Vicinamibacterales bacterium]|nr:AAA family ATPase [Vicinamibacterales bacterium]